MLSALRSRGEGSRGTVGRRWAGDRRGEAVRRDQAVADGDQPRHVLPIGSRVVRRIAADPLLPTKGGTSNGSPRVSTASGWTGCGLHRDRGAIASGGTEDLASAASETELPSAAACSVASSGPRCSWCVRPDVQAGAAVDGVLELPAARTPSRIRPRLGPGHTAGTARSGGPGGARASSSRLRDHTSSAGAGSAGLWLVGGGDLAIEVVDDVLEVRDHLPELVPERRQRLLLDHPVFLLLVVCPVGRLAAEHPDETGCTPRQSAARLRAEGPGLVVHLQAAEGAGGPSPARRGRRR